MLSQFGAVPKWSKERSAKPSFAGSNPARASMLMRKDKWWYEVPPDSLWYLVGLITSDGCLSADGRHVDITAKDKDFLEKVRQEFKLHSKIREKRNEQNQVSHSLQISSKAFYLFLLSLNLIPRKSKKLGGLIVPEPLFHSFIRGVIDGDGCIRNWIHPQNGREQWSIRIYSGSNLFLQWLSKKIAILYGLYGALHQNQSGNVSVLKYGKMATQRLLILCYSEGSLCLQRKYRKARECIESTTSWSKSKTVRSIARVVEQVDTRDSSGSPL